MSPAESAKRRLADRRFAEAEALCRQALMAGDSESGLHNLLGAALLGQKRFQEASAAFERAVQRDKARPDVWYNLALALLGAGRQDEAIACLRQAVSLAPDSGTIVGKLGQLLSLQGSPEEAVEALERAAALEPESAPHRMNLSVAQLDLGRPEAAEQSNARALELSPGDSNAQLLRNRILQQQGRFEEAKGILEGLIRAHPDWAAPYFSLCYAGRVGPEDGRLIERLQTMAEQPRASLDELALIQYALGKCFEDTEQHKQAMGAYDAANEICLAIRSRLGQRFDREIYSQNLDRIVEFCGQEAGAEGPTRPVFIVGMVRSGTTLVEQTLAAHPRVAPAGERSFWLTRRARNPSSVDTPDWIEESRREYDALLDRVSKTAERITDKMPMNYHVLGAILRAYPSAKVIHCRRDPLDTTLSVFVTPYRSAPEFAHDRGDIVYAYREYQRVMAHWRQAFPSAQILDVDYESMTEDFQEAARRIVEFVELPWNDKCAQPNLSRHTPNTPSQWQVRQPVYRSSVGRWRKFAPWLGELRSLEM